MSTNSSEAALTVAVDIGGTFTDVALRDDASGRVWRAKTPSVPSDPSQAFLAGVELALRAAGREAAALGRVLHGTTVATNMILENKGAAAALITTAGFRHVLTIGRQDIPRRANLYAWVKPPRPVPASRVFEVRERVAAGGAVLTPLDEASVRAAAARCRALGVSAVAVCLLHAYANPSHERRTAEILAQELPGVAVTASSDVLPVVREFERSLATALNAVVTPGVATYIARLEQRLADLKVDAPLLLMQSNGGVAGAARIREAAITTALSGPAAGVVGAREAAAECGVDNLITVDIGGTSADICLIEKGRIGLTQSGHVGGWPLPLPMLDMVTIGAGGGSIARLRDGALVVGPESAGADPGPACYGRGGALSTVTDAHVVLGHLPASLLGGRMRLDAEASRRVVEETIARPLGLSVEAAAQGVLAIVDNNMMGALRVVSVERGRNPADFTLTPFGGAGPLHGCALARLLGVSRVLIPVAPGVLCADGLLAADIKAEFARTLAQADVVDMGAAHAIFAELEAKAEAWLEAERIPAARRSFARAALMRYRGQGGEVATPWRDEAAALESAFETQHRGLYGFTLDAPIECVTLRVEAVGAVGAPPRQTAPRGAGARPAATHPMFVEGRRIAAPVYDRATLGAGDRFTGPAIVTQLDATTLVHAGWRAEVMANGALLLVDESSAEGMRA
ncbi:MAG: hydantoinase/oxoprolinase family protein [Methylobacteriaceae bacterium]|nr:hydantoinase/oxoprolinase family protein [Methylobacteriaceae bacterium]